jgi:capsular polysaccharide biosynthesis protein
MDERKFSNAYILERATPPLPKAGRSFIILLLIGLIGAGGLAVGVAFGLEYLNSTIRNESDIEEQIGLPVLAAIQYHGDFRALPSK